MIRKPAKPIKGNFSDGAKRRAGVEVSSIELQIADLKRAHEGVLALKTARIETLEEAVRLAIIASDEGRRGDCARILRRVMPQKPKPPTSKEPEEPRRA